MCPKLGLSLSYLTCTSPWEKRMSSSDHHMGRQCLKTAGCFLQHLPRPVTSSAILTWKKTARAALSCSGCLCISADCRFEWLHSQSAAGSAVKGENEPLSEALEALGPEDGHSVGLWISWMDLQKFVNIMFANFNMGSVTWLNFSKGPSIQRRLRTSSLHHWKRPIIYLTFPACSWHWPSSQHFSTPSPGG